MQRIVDCRLGDVYRPAVVFTPYLRWLTPFRYHDGIGGDWADIIDVLTMHPEARRRVVRLLAEIDAAGAR
jgi:hypothetical protein